MQSKTPKSAPRFPLPRTCHSVSVVGGGIHKRQTYCKALSFAAKDPHGSRTLTTRLGRVRAAYRRLCLSRVVAAPRLRKSLAESPISSASQLTSLSAIGRYRAVEGYHVMDGRTRVKERSLTQVPKLERSLFIACIMHRYRCTQRSCSDNITMRAVWRPSDSRQRTRCTELPRRMASQLPRSVTSTASDHGRSSP